MTVHIFTDGGARGNPGPAAIGVVITNKNNEVIQEYGKYIGEQTNNFAEYSALIYGLESAKALDAKEVICFLDSKLVVEQLNRNWKIKEPTLQKLFVQAWNALQHFSSYSLSYIPRAQNKAADKQVNIALDNYLQ